MLRFYNYLTRKKEKFTPVNPPEVGLYTCGPTVYDFAHIGNLRTFVFEDWLRRVLEYNDYKVKHVMNITDIEDKIIKRAQKEGVDFRQITRRYTRAFFEDLKKLNILPAHHYPTVTEHIGEIIQFIGVLLEKGYAYQAEDSSVYFDISKSENYGKLARLDQQELQAGRRVLADEYEKQAVADFALWKAKTNPKGLEAAWGAPWGRGRPGWHIECSVLALKYLTDERNRTIDIHTGAIDLLFPHHTNEIAQSEAATSRKFVNFWLESEHLLVKGEKMAKSQGNYYVLRDVEEKGFDPLAFRYLCLQTHYRQKLNFTWESLSAAQKALARLREQTTNYELRITNHEKDLWQGRCAEHELKFLEAINDDLGLPQALAVVWEVVKSEYPARLKLPTLLKFDEVLGLGLAKAAQGNSSREALSGGVKQLATEREKLRQQGEFEKADKLRSKIESLGFKVEDTPQGPRIKFSGL